MADQASFAQLVEAARAQPPCAAVVLGSGLHELSQRLRDTLTVPFHAVPGLEDPAVAGHRGVLTYGTWAGQRVLLFQGRLHFYEGHPWDKVTQPVKVAHGLGARVLLLTNAAGG